MDLSCVLNLKLVVNFSLQVKLPQMDEPAQIML